MARRNSGRLFSMVLLIVLVLWAGPPVAAAPVEADGEEEASSGSLALSLSAASVAGGVRYAVALGNSGRVDLSDLRLTVTLPEDAELVQAMETSRARLIDNDAVHLSWTASFAAGEAPDPFIFVLREPPSAPISVDAAWEGGQAHIAAAPSPATAIENEGAVTLGDGDGQAGATGITVTGEENLRGATVQVRRLGAEANPPAGTGDLWWCSVIAIDGVPDGQRVAVKVPARQPLAPYSAVKVFALRNDAWVETDGVGVVSADGQFISFLHSGGVMATGVGAALQPLTAALKPFMQFDFDSATLPPNADTSVIVTLRFFVSTPGNDTLVVDGDNQFAVIGSGANPFPNTTCSANSNNNGSCRITALSPQTEPRFILLLHTSAPTPRIGCLIADFALNTPRQILGRACRYIVPSPLDVAYTLASSGGGAGQSPVNVNSNVTLTIQPKVLTGATSGGFITFTLPETLDFVSATSPQGVTPPWSCAVPENFSRTFNCLLRSTTQASAGGNLPALTLTVKVNTCVVSIPFSYRTLAPDQVAGNDTASVSLRINCPVLTFGGYSVSPPGPFTDVATDLVTYTASIVNLGAAATTGTLTARLVLPEALDTSPDNLLPGQWSCTVINFGSDNGKDVVCTSSQSIPAGGSKSFSVRARYIGTACILAATDVKARAKPVKLTVSGGGAPTIETSKDVVVASCL